MPKSASIGICLIAIFTFLSCNRAGSQKNTSQGNFRLNGKLTFLEYQPYRGVPVGIVEVNLSDIRKKRLGYGSHPWRHAKGDIILAKGCGDDVNRLVIHEENGKETIVSMCSSEIPNPGYLSTAFEFARLSPDKKLIAAEAKYYLNNGYRYSTVIIKNKEIIKVFDNFGAPEWLPDGRLLLVSDGMYITEINGTLKKIDDGTLSSGPNNPDLDPSGKRIAFEWNQRIWVMDIDGSNLKEIASGNALYRFPAWSPNGKYVAFLAHEGYSFTGWYRGVYVVEVDSGKHQYIDFTHLLDGELGNVPFGPLSWTE
ncbi:hypothetical protein [Allomuricauda sp. d1]|uniref:hypothetical protein n=1 Tax=Allomuricauda sp. d1 TaxID=3136725 RepID=UPI0031D4B2CB